MEDAYPRRYVWNESQERNQQVMAQSMPERSHTD